MELKIASIFYTYHTISLHYCIYYLEEKYFLTLLSCFKNSTQLLANIKDVFRLLEINWKRTQMRKKHIFLKCFCHSSFSFPATLSTAAL